MSPTADALIKKHAGLVKKLNGPGCSVGGSKHRALIEALCDRGLQATAIGRILKAEKIPVSANMVAYHRRKACACQQH